MKDSKKLLSSYSFFTIATATLSGFLFGYYMAIISGALQFISSAFHFSLGQESMFVSTLLLGAVLGSSVGGTLTSRLGRKKVFVLTCFLLILGCFLLITTSSYPLLIIARLIQGLGIGIISVVAPLYLGEISPAAHRGAVVSAYQLMMNMGILVAYIVNYGLTSTANWERMFLIGLIPAALQVFFLFFIPESPLWLFRKGRKALAEDSLKKLQLPPVKSCEQKTIQVNGKTLSFLIFIGILLSIFQQISGVNILIYYAPRIFHEAGYITPLSAMLATMCLGFANVLGCVVSVWLLDRVGRRKLLLISIFGMMVSLLCLSVSSFCNIPFMDTLSPCVLFTFIFLFSMGSGPITWVLLSEIFPPQIRDKGMTFSLVANWASVCLVLWTFPYLFAWMKISGTFGLYTLMNLLAFFFVFRYIPETKQKSLEEIAKLFKKD